MKDLKVIILLLLSLLAAGCRDESADTVIGIISDSSATLAVIDSGEKYLYIASMPVPALLTYRSGLLKEGVLLDNFESLEKLSGLELTYRISGEQEAWDQLYKRDGLSLAERLNVLKSEEMESLLAALAPLTDDNIPRKELETLLSFYRESRYVLRVYQMATFFSGKGESALVERNTKEWVRASLNEIELRSIE